jgi:hypothetical protein
MAENIFGAVNAYLKAMKGKCDPLQKNKVSKVQKSTSLVQDTDICQLLIMWKVPTAANPLKQF